MTQLTGFPVQPNKAVVGDNAFAHESGIHQDGVLKDRTTYEIMTPENVGLVESEIVPGQALRPPRPQDQLEELGFYLDDKGLDRAFIRFKELADKKKEVAVKDLEAIAPWTRSAPWRSSSSSKLHEPVRRQRASPSRRSLERVAARARTVEATSTGDGQVDAVCKAISRPPR